MLQRQKTHKIPPPQFAFHCPGRNPGSGRHSLKKREERNVSNVPKIKNKQNSSTLAYLSLSRLKSRF